MNAFLELTWLTPGGGRSHGRVAALPTGKFAEKEGVIARVGRGGDDLVVAGDLAFHRQAAGQDPHRGMEEEQRTQCLLAEVRPIISTQQVRHLVS